MASKERKPGSSMTEGSLSSTGNHGSLDKETQTKIGRQLRAMYDDVVRQGVPDRFADLLKRLERSEDEEPKS